MNIVILDNDEEFIQHLDPELCSLTETIEKGGLRTLTLDYKFQDAVEDKKLFKLGNKVWVSRDSNLTDCLYVINIFYIIVVIICRVSVLIVYVDCCIGIQEIIL